MDGSGAYGGGDVVVCGGVLRLQSMRNCRDLGKQNVIYRGLDGGMA